MSAIGHIVGVSRVPAYGGLSVTGNSTAETTTDATPRKIGAFDTADPNSRVTVSAAADTLTVVDSGDYLVIMNMTIGGSANSDYLVELYIDGDSSGVLSEVTHVAVASVITMGFSRTVSLTAGEVLSLFHWSSDGGTSFTVREGSFSISKQV